MSTPSTMQDLITIYVGDQAAVVSTAAAETLAVAANSAAVVQLGTDSGTLETALAALPSPGQVAVLSADGTFVTVYSAVNGVISTQVIPTAVNVPIPAPAPAPAPSAS